MLGKSDAGINRSRVNQKVAQLRRRLSADSRHSVLELIKFLDPEWIVVLENRIVSDKFRMLADFVAKERAGSTPIYPPPDQVSKFEIISEINLADHCSTSYLNLIAFGYRVPHHFQ